MEKGKVTVIVPVYNEETHIERCIKSILKQTYQNMEIILINDGSKDNSLKILKEFEKEYPSKIRVFTHKNKGLGLTRNVGLDNATGEYITFLDSDDWMDKDYIETLTKQIGDNDIIISGFKRFNSNYEFEYLKEPKISEWSKYKYCSIAGKMYRNEFIQKNKLRYKKVKMGEDSYFNINAYTKTTKVKVIQYAGYCNYENLSSMTNDITYDEQKSFYNLLRSLIKEVDTSKLNQDQFCFYILKNLIVDIVLYKDCLSTKKLIKNYGEHIAWYKSYLNKVEKRFKIYWQEGEEFKINLLLNIFVISTKLHIANLVIKLIKKMDVKMI